MKKFLVLYVSSASSADEMKNATPEQMKAGMELWMQWSQKNAAGIMDLGAPLANARHVQKRSSRNVGSEVSGFSILQADSMDAVLKMLEEHPHFHSPGASIQVHEFLPIPGM